jgi:hypothetical protein
MKPQCLSLTAVVALACAARAEQDAPREWIVNGDFERDDDGEGKPDEWRFEPGAGPAEIAGQLTRAPGRGGGLAARVECTKFVKGHAMLAQLGHVQIEQGQWYRVRLWAKWDGEGYGQAWVGLQDTANWGGRGLWESLNLSRGWQETDLTFQATGSVGDTSRFQIWFTGTGVLLVDDVSFVGPVAAPERGGPIDIEGAVNFVENSSFEVGPAGWTSRRAGHLFGEVVEGGWHGRYAFQIALTPETLPWYSFDYFDPVHEPIRDPLLTNERHFPLTPGQRYVLSVYAKSDVASVPLRFDLLR